MTVPAPGAPPVTVAVVSFDTRALLLRCLDSLEPEADAGRVQVWVVDNSSSDGSAAAARERAPWARILEPGENLGFGRAVNLVAAQTGSPWLACANADVALEPGALEALLAAGAARSVGCVAPRLVLADGSTEHSVFPFPTIPFTVAFNLGLHRLSRRLGDRLCLQGLWDPGRPRAVPWAIGAFLLLWREAFDEVGGFDARRWLYAAFGDDRIPRSTRATYAVLLRRRGLARTWITAAVNVAGAAARVAWMAPLASVVGRWRGPLRRSRMWLSAHRQGLRSPSSLRRENQRRSPRRSASRESGQG
jgi:glycosyltransferase involved in cell wall biosynthesis